MGLADVVAPLLHTAPTTPTELGMTATSPITQDRVDVLDGAVLIRDLVETDAEVLRVVGDAADAVEPTRQCLRIGARAILAVNATVDTHIVEQRFDAMSAQITQQLDDTVAKIAATTESLLAEDGGALTLTLAGHRDGLEELLGDTFDPDSKRSVIAIFEQVIADAQEAQVEGIRRLVATDDEDGPLGRLRHEITRHANECTRELRQEVQALSERIAVKEAVAPVIAITTAKGFTYEDAVHDAVGRIAAPHGDRAEQTGKVSGSAATQKGDEVVTLATDDTMGAEACFVLEAKSRRLNLRRTHEELDAARENRDALAAIAVFSSQDEAPTSVPFSYSGDKAIVVYDTEDGDDSALRLAYMWARWVVRRELAGAAAEDIDVERIGILIDDALRAIDRVTAIKRAHTHARKLIDQAGEQVALMAGEVRDALDAVGDELRAVEET
jgi:hypothetical protein